MRRVSGLRLAIDIINRRKRYKARRIQNILNTIVLIKTDTENSIHSLILADKVALIKSF